MGIIHLAEAVGPGGFEKLVVVKVLKQELADDPVYTAMFLDEARLAARLTHRHIVQTNEVGCEDGQYFMALELLEGGSLHQISKKLGLRALPTNLGLRVLVAVLDALEHAHGLAGRDGEPLGIVHRDVSPQNVFLTFDGDVKLIDFGVAKSADRRGAAVTQVGVVKGSIPYMSPDHVDGAIIDGRADVFAAGAILRELLLGERLWGDASDLTMLRRLIARDVPAFPATADVPEALRAIVVQAMAPKRDDRFTSAGAMRDALEAYLAEVDPRGSLEDLAPWLGAALKEERAAFAGLVRRGRASLTATTPHVWLPSNDLLTRVSGVPGFALAAPPPVPSLPARAAAKPSRARSALAGVMLAAALVLTGFGLAQPRGGSDTLEARVPRTAENTAKTTLVTSLAIMERAPEPSSEVGAAAATVVSDSTSTASSIPASVLHQGVPPNPYDPAE